MPYNPEDFGLGYAIHHEDRARLTALARQFSCNDHLAGASTFEPPKSISHRYWRKIRNQLRMGSCSGNSRASGEEVLNWIGTGESKRFSAMYCYLKNQEACGLLGRDAGATIDGSCRAARDSGVCLEETFPYPNPVRYSTNIPDGAQQEGRLHVIKSWSVMRSYDDCLKWLQSGIGVILDGTPWLTGMTTDSPNLELSDLRGNELGWHAKVIHGFGEVDPRWEHANDGTERTFFDSDGRPYLDEENSHGEGYGDHGYKLISPKVIDNWIRNGSTLIGISDLDVYGCRQIDSFRGFMS